MANGGSCVVCAQPESDPSALQVCANCGGAFHLNPGQGPGVDCGIVGLGDEQNPALLFVCNDCLHLSASGRPAARRVRRVDGASRAG